MCSCESFQGKIVVSVFGARLATSIAASYGCAGTLSGAIRSGVRIDLTKSRETVKTKSARLVYILVRKSWILSLVMSGNFSHNGGAQRFVLFW